MSGTDNRIMPPAILAGIPQTTTYWKNGRKAFEWATTDCRATAAIFDEKGNRLSPRFLFDPDKLWLLGLHREFDREPHGRASKRMVGLRNDMNRECAMSAHVVGMPFFFGDIVEHKNVDGRYSPVHWAPSMGKDRKRASYETIMLLAQQMLISIARNMGAHYDAPSAPDEPRLLLALPVD